MKSKAGSIAKIMTPGFTIIELIVVITIIGILATLAVPRFFHVVETAHNANKLAVVGVVRTALNNWAMQKAASTGSMIFPSSVDITNLTVLLDDIPDSWSFDGTTLSYSGDGTSWSYSQGGITYKLKLN